MLLNVQLQAPIALAPERDFSYNRMIEPIAKPLALAAWRLVTASRAVVAAVATARLRHAVI